MQAPFGNFPFHPRISWSTFPIFHVCSHPYRLSTTHRKNLFLSKSSLPLADQSSSKHITLCSILLSKQIKTSSKKKFVFFKLKKNLGNRLDNLHVAARVALNGVTMGLSTIASFIRPRVAFLRLVLKQRSPSVDRRASACK